MNQQLKTLQQQLREEPTNPELHFELASYYDGEGDERSAIPHYEQALHLGLSSDKILYAYIQLGSSWRCIGEYERAIHVLKQGLTLFPDNGALQVFLEMTLYNMNQHHEAIKVLLDVINRTTNDEEIHKYGRALSFYRENLNEVY